MSLRKPKLKIDWIRVEAAFYDLPEIIHDKKTGMISFRGMNRVRLNIYTTTATVVTKKGNGPFVVSRDNSFEDVISTMSKLSRF